MKTKDCDKLYNTKNIASRIKSIREKTGMTQSEFAGKYNIPKRTLESWEMGERIPPEYVIELLEKIEKE